MWFGEANAVLSILSKVWTWGRKWIKDAPEETVAGRFIRVFESHGVHRNQVPRFFGHGLSLADVQSDDALFAKLDDQMLDAACEMFAVRREWLDGAEKQAHPIHDFYKEPGEFREFLSSLQRANPGVELRGTLYFPKEATGDEALLILEERIGFIGDKPISRFHLCENWSVRYWKSRAYLTACVAIAWKSKAYINGRYLPAKDIDRLRTGKALLGWGGDGLPSAGRLWHPDDMPVHPEKYLDGVDPERNRFGHAAALSLWLELAEQEYMDIGINGDPKPLFRKELAKYQRISSKARRS